MFSGLLAAAPTGGARPTAPEAEILRVVNQVRAQNGLAPLRLDLRLEAAARGKSRSMIRSGVFAHGDVGRRLAASGARGPVFGENLAWALGSGASASGIVRMWLNSPTHRANLLRPGFRRIGVGRVVGPFQGYQGAAVVTANFAGR